MKIKVTLFPFPAWRSVICAEQGAQASFLDATRNHGGPGASRSQIGFTLVELIVVIAVIATLAALTMPVFNIVSQHALIQRAQSEREQLVTAIDSYHAKYGYYPPSNSNPGTPTTNQLYYELSGTTTNGANNTTNFVTLDNSSSVSLNLITAYFGVGGFMNCTRGSGDDAIIAKSFLTDLKPGQIGAATNGDGTVTCVITTGVNSDSFYHPPLPGFTSKAGYPANPWRYVYPGVNNPNSYDLWVQIYVGGKTNLICNWFDQPKINQSALYNK